MWRFNKKKNKIVLNLRTWWANYGTEEDKKLSAHNLYRDLHLQVKRNRYNYIKTAMQQHI